MEIIILIEIYTYASVSRERCNCSKSRFSELTDDMEMKISGWLRPQPGGQVLIEKFRLQITRNDIATLAGLNWLNDEVCILG